MLNFPEWGNGMTEKGDPMLPPIYFKSKIKNKKKYAVDILNRIL